MEGRFYSQFFRLYLSRLLRCAAARLVSRAPRYCHVTSSLRELHWLPVRQRINYKILLLTFKTIHGKTPVYLQELISVNMPGAIRLRSSPSVVSYLNRHLFELEPPWAISHFKQTRQNCEMLCCMKSALFLTSILSSAILGHACLETLFLFLKVYLLFFLITYNISYIIC